MHRRSTAIAAIAAVIVVLVAGLAWQRWSGGNERMAAPAPLAPRTTRETAQRAPAPAERPAEAERTTSMVGGASATHAPARRSDQIAAPPVQPSREAAAAPAKAPAPPLKAPAPPAKAPAPRAPTFDIVRVEPNGDALVAGQAPPNSTVTLTDRDHTLAQAQADAGGNFVITPPPLPSGDHALGLRAGQGGDAAAAPSKQSVVVSVPRSRSDQVIVALAEPNRPTRLLSAPPNTPDAARSAPASGAAPVVPATPPQLAIRSVELENGSGLFASGVAPPGTDVRLYLNNSRVADVIAAAAGAWTVTVRKGLTAGRYAVRADSIKPDKSVTARVEVPFDVPSAMNPAPASSSHGSESPKAAVTEALVPPASREVSSGRADGRIGAAGDAAVARDPTSPNAPGHTVVDELETELVARGDNLWRISRKRLGFGTRYTQIYAANVAQIRDPRLIYPGQIFVLPR